MNKNYCRENLWRKFDMKITKIYNTVYAFATQRNATQRIPQLYLNNNFKFYISQFIFFYKRIQNSCSFFVEKKNQKTTTFFVKKVDKKTITVGLRNLFVKTFSLCAESLLIYSMHLILK